jgi:hypothetical protein
MATADKSGGTGFQSLSLCKASGGQWCPDEDSGVGVLFFWRKISNIGSRSVRPLSIKYVIPSPNE